jgi:copper chaperone CopZ
MRTRLLFFSAAFFLLNVSIAQYRNIEIHAAGLTCSLCSNAIQKALKSLPFVEGVQTELKSNKFTIEQRQGVPVDLDAISRKVEDAGFSVGKLTLEVKFNSVEIKNDVHTVANGQTFHFLNVKPQKVEGWQKVQLLDKNFVLSADAKKNAKLTTKDCYKTGTMASCCGDAAGAKSTRVFHVTI